VGKSRIDKPGMQPTHATEEQKQRRTVEISGHVLARNTLINLFGRVLPMLVAVAAMPYVVHHLGPDRFGLLSLAWVVTGYFALFDLGIGPATTKFVAEALGRGEVETLPELVGTALATQTCMGLVAGLLLAAATPLLVHRVLKIPPGLQGEAEVVFWVMAAGLPLGFAAGSLGGVLAAAQRFDLFNAVAVPSSALTYLLPVVVLALGFGLPLIVLFLVLARAASVLASYWLCVRLFGHLRRLRLEKCMVRRLLRFGGWVAVSGIVSPLLDYFDRFFIGAIVSVAAIGFYTPAYTIATRITLLPSSLAATLFPAFSSFAARGDAQYAGRLLWRSLKLLLLLVGPCILALAFFARPLLKIWLGSQFAAGATVPLQILAVGVLFNSLAYVPYNLLYGIGRPDLNAKFHLAELPVHLWLLWYLVTHLALAGAALAWTFRATLDFLLLLAAACRLLRRSLGMLAVRDLWRSLGALALMAAGLAVLGLSTRATFIKALIVIILICGFLLYTWQYALDSEERRQLKAWLRVSR
jgi:O-antigen/teichoic acid export membrane protein